jgi:hypothetical protein
LSSGIPLSGPPPCALAYKIHAPERAAAHGLLLWPQIA